jgi:hypothetical protein
MAPFVFNFLCRVSSLVQGVLSKVKVQLSVCTLLTHILGVEVWFHDFLPFTLDDGKGSASRPGRFTHRAY